MAAPETTIGMLQCMRWYGPHDRVALEGIRQAGVGGIVTALHHIPVGEVWPKEAIRERQRNIRQAGMEWEVVESLPVSEDIKQQKGDFRQHLENYKTSLQNLGACGVRTVTYNFMPVLDWVRTDVAYRNPDGTRTLRFDPVAFAYFDLRMLRRPGAEAGYSPEMLQRVNAFAGEATPEELAGLRRSVLMGLPGSDEHFTEAQLLELLAHYKDITSETYRSHLIDFLAEVVPVAKEAGVVLAVHPDDPPFPLLGLPRVVSGYQDLQRIFEAVPDAANGLCLCTGSLGAGKGNVLPEILEAFGSRVHFLHLRNVVHEESGAFRESEHLGGWVPMERMVSGILELMEKRGVSLPMRPDHGFLFTLEKDGGAYPGYSLIGRLKGLAELRGLEHGLQYKSLSNGGS